VNLPATLPTLALACLIAGCSRSPPSGASDAPGAGPVSAAERSTPYAVALDDANAAVRAAEARADAEPVGWVPQEALALALLDRAQLTGSYEDYNAANLAAGLALLRGGKHGPCLAAARVHLALHRLDHATAAVADCAARDATTSDDRAELEAIAAEVAFQEGRYDKALRGYRASLRLEESVTGLARLSQYHASTGAPAEAAALLDRAERIYHGTSARPLAWLALQRGLLALDAGRWDDALVHYLHAQRLMPGWWLAEEHIAEVHALRGDLDDALARYRDLAQRTGHPEFMDAIARILLEQNQRAEAAQWISRARAIHDQRFATLPAAAAGHALEHYLQFEPLDEDRLRWILRMEAQTRPGAEAQLHDAQVLLRLGRPDAAASSLERLLASPWNTAKLHAVAAQVYAAQRDAAAASRAEAKALAMNPHALRMYALVPPGSDS